MMELVRKHENNKKLSSIVKESPKYMRELNVEEQITSPNHELAPRKAAKINETKKQSQKVLKS